MPNTDERGEIAGRVNAKEAQVIQQSKKLASKTKQQSASMEAKNRLRSAEALKERPVRTRTAGHVDGILFLGNLDALPYIRQPQEQLRQSVSAAI
jgi:hypothetical protein